jgi:hypothetical protein
LADRVGADEAGALTVAQVVVGLAEEVHAQVGAAGDAGEGASEGGHVEVRALCGELAGVEERRVADDRRDVGPRAEQGVGLATMSGSLSSSGFARRRRSVVLASSTARGSMSRPWSWARRMRRSGAAEAGEELRSSERSSR